MKNLIAACLIAAGILGLGGAPDASARTPADERGTFSFIVDNDILLGTDQRYTNGVRLGWLAPPAERADGTESGLSRLLRDALEPLPFVGLDGHRHSAAVTLTQVMVTPDNIEATELLPDQAPYYGQLTLGLSLYAWNADEYHALGVSVGVVGPDSKAAETQRLIHRWIGSTEPRGWQNQVGRRTTADVSYLYGHRVSRQAWSDGRTSDFTLNYGLTVGSPETSASVGGVWRWGRNLPDSFNVYFADGGGEGALLSLAERPARSGWFVYGGAMGTLLGYSTLEQSTRNTHRFTRRNGVGSAVAGVSVYRGRWQVGLSVQADTSPVHQDKRAVSYGSLYVIWTP